MNTVFIFDWAPDVLPFHGDILPKQYNVRNRIHRIFCPFSYLINFTITRITTAKTITPAKRVPQLFTKKSSIVIPPQTFYTFTFFFNILLFLYGRNSINSINATIKNATIEPIIFPLPVNKLPSWKITKAIA